MSKVKHEVHMDDRTPRTVDLRDWDSRDAEIRNVLQMQHISAFHIPAEKIPDGIEYFWAAESIRGKPDTTRVSELMQKGWRTVPPERHPERYPMDFLNKNENLRGCIACKGAVLMERPKKYGDIEREMERKEMYKVLHSIPGMDNLLGTPGIPLVKAINQVTTSMEVASGSATHREGRTFQN